MRMRSENKAVAAAAIALCGAAVILPFSWNSFVRGKLSRAQAIKAEEEDDEKNHETYLMRVIVNHRRSEKGLPPYSWTDSHSPTASGRMPAGLLRSLSVSDVPPQDLAPAINLLTNSQGVTTGTIAPISTEAAAVLGAVERAVSKR